MAGYERRLRRGRSFWDRVSRFSAPLEGAADLFEVHAADLLGLRDGDTVLDIGCGTGPAFPGLRAAVGDRGRVVGIDLSPRMLEAARRRVAEHGWTDADVVEADFADWDHAPVDAAVAIFSISAMADVTAALTTAYRLLEPGGRLVVADVRFGGDGLAGRLAATVRLGYRLRTGSSGRDPLAAARAVFPVVEVHPAWGDGGHRARGLVPVCLFVARKG